MGRLPKPDFQTLLNHFDELINRDEARYYEVPEDDIETPVEEEAKQKESEARRLLNEERRIVSEARIELYEARWQGFDVEIRLAVVKARIEALRVEKYVGGVPRRIT